MSRRPAGPRARTAFLASVGLHAVAIGAMTLGALTAKPAPRQVRVYRVDIVSPAPNVLGEPPAEEPATAAPAPAAEAPAEPEPAPPEPAPEPPKAEPQPETPKEPAPRREEPKRPAPRASETPPRETRPPAPKNREPAERTAAERTTGSGQRNVPATGRTPDPRSPGGEGLNVRTQGVACPENYCNNVVRQVRRFFRAPEGTQGASGNVCFTLFRDGSVNNVTVERQRGGGFQFRLALVEAVEQAGLQRAFGRLPSGFEAESIQLCVLMSPATT